MKKFMVEARIDKLHVKSQFFEIFDDFQLIHASDEKDAYHKYVNFWQDRCNQFIAYSPNVVSIQTLNGQAETS